ncbi:MAG: redoxin domain-containing protein [Planctomycetota bacterium]
MTSRNPIPVLAALAALLVGCGRSADDPGAAKAPAPAKRVVAEVQGASSAGLGEVVEDFAWRDVDGEAGSLRAYAAGRPVVIVIRDRHCPVTKKYGRTVAALERRLSDRGVPFLFVAPGASDTLDEARADRDAFAFRGPYVHEPSGDLGRRLHVSSTAEVFLLDREGRLVYRGAIDDRFGVGVTHEEARRHFLVEAVEDLLAGRPVAIPATTAPGCFLDFESAPVVDDDAPEFHRDIEPILQRACQICHRPGENAPFDLVDYDDVAGRRTMVKRVLRAGSMPPWYADPKVGGPWANDLRMSAADKERLLAWLEADCPRGDPADAPPPLPVTKGWKIGEPDLLLRVPEAVEVPPEGWYNYRYVLVDTGLEEDRWISSLEVRATEPSAVHHILVFEHRPEMEAWTTLELGFLALRGFFGIYVPGCEPIQYPSDRGKLLRKGTKLLLQIHYAGNGRTVTDRPEIGIRFRDDAPRFALRCDAAYSVDINLAPGAKDVAVSGDYVFDRPARLFGFMPHMHARGVRFEMTLILPDGRLQRVLSIPEFDFNWQQAYRLVTPIDVPKGTVVRATGVYDNSSANPANPDPEAWVSFGLATEDEMLIGYFEWLALDD